MRITRRLVTVLWQTIIEDVETIRVRGYYILYVFLLHGVGVRVFIVWTGVGVPRREIFQVRQRGGVFSVRPRDGVLAVALFIINKSAAAKVLTFIMFMVELTFYVWCLNSCSY